MASPLRRNLYGVAVLTSLIWRRKFLADLLKSDAFMSLSFFFLSIFLLYPSLCAFLCVYACEVGKCLCHFFSKKSTVISLSLTSTFSLHLHISAPTYMWLVIPVCVCMCVHVSVPPTPKCPILAITNSTVHPAVAIPQCWSKGAQRLANNLIGIKSFPLDTRHEIVKEESRRFHQS